MSAQRDQIELRAVDLDAMLSADHPARSVRAFVQALDLEPLYAQIKSRDGGRGAPAIDPAILVALRLLAMVEGVRSARELARLCERDDAYRWVCGGVGQAARERAAKAREQRLAKANQQMVFRSQLLRAAPRLRPPGTSRP